MINHNLDILVSVVFDLHCCEIRDQILPNPDPLELLLAEATFVIGLVSDLECRADKVVVRYHVWLIHFLIVETGGLGDLDPLLHHISRVFEDGHPIDTLILADHERLTVHGADTFRNSALYILYI